MKLKNFTLKGVLSALFAISLIFIISFLLKEQAYALSTTFPEFNVEIEIEEDSTFTVTESAVYEFTGDLNGFRRDIPLYDAPKQERCINNPNETCGGFEFIKVEEVRIDGMTLEDDEFEVYEVDYENGSRYFRIEKRLYDQETFVRNEQFDIEITYTIYGGIQWLDYRGDTRPIFYWNLLPEEHGLIEESTIEINFPNSIDLKESNIELFSSQFKSFQVSTDKITLESKNISDFDVPTLLYFFEEDELEKTGGLDYNLTNIALNADIYLDDIYIGSEPSGSIDFFPTGKYTFRAKANGYQEYSQKVQITSDSVSEISVNLEPTFFMRLLLSSSYAQLIIGIFLIPILGIRSYRYVRNKGRDKGLKQTVVPEYKPPQNIPPYLLGSLKDEKVDQVDITGTIIDLAYRGYLKIKELKKKKNYELTKTGKDEKNLTQTEKNILDALFGKKDTIKTEDLDHSFVTSIEKITNSIYQEMVERQFFDESPKRVRESALGLGIALFMFGLLLFAATSFGLSFITNSWQIAAIFIPMVLVGLIRLIFAHQMPAKTQLGSEKFNQARGFKMYMETAERYRVQNLTPDMFEKFLSFAVIFGIEKQWAKQFEGIYEGQPEWFESNSGDVFTPIYLANLSNNFNTSTANKIKSIQAAQSNSGAGGGWSSGGSFSGGFSGGGGGGGSAGGW